MNALLISVHGKYCTMYANGTKKIEVRKQQPKEDFNRTVFIYNTSTKQIEFKGVLMDVLKLPYRTVSEIYRSQTGLNEKELRQYAGQREALTLLDFFHVVTLKNPVSLNQMRAAGITPPQGYLYINPETLNLN